MKKLKQKVFFVIIFTKNDKQFFSKYFVNILAAKEHKEQLIKSNFKTSFKITMINNESIKQFENQ